MLNIPSLLVNPLLPCTCPQRTRILVVWFVISNLKKQKVGLNEHNLFDNSIYSIILTVNVYSKVVNEGIISAG